MKILGIDYGRKKLGLALSEGFLAEPLGIIQRKNWETSLKMICEEQAVDKIVIGLVEGKMGEEIQDFTEEVNVIIGLPVEFQDETLTSHEAVAKMREIGKKIKDEDAVAAALILQAYLEKNV